MPYGRSCRRGAPEIPAQAADPAARALLILSAGVRNGRTGPGRSGAAPAPMPPPDVVRSRRPLRRTLIRAGERPAVHSKNLVSIGIVLLPPAKPARGRSPRRRSVFALPNSMAPRSLRLASGLSGSLPPTNIEHAAPISAASVASRSVAHARWFALLAVSTVTRNVRTGALPSVFCSRRSFVGCRSPLPGEGGGRLTVAHSASWASATALVCLRGGRRVRARLGCEVGRAVPGLATRARLTMMATDA